MLRVFLLIALLFLPGCANWFVEQPKGPWAILRHEFHQCLSNLKDDSELRPIAGKVTLDTLYDRDEYFDLLNIEESPSAKEKIAIRKWASKLERCYKIQAESYAYEPPEVAKWSAATDSEQILLVWELYKGNLSYGQFAAKRLEIDTKYRGQIMNAIAADYKKPENLQRPNSNESPKLPSSSSSSCGWEGAHWVCRSL
ncbi:MAG: hypothetical protein HZB47_00880 [Nitrosomonadales bacterium]|nr:hypothetical protein [Nitrosomonadales bacterium]